MTVSRSTICSLRAAREVTSLMVEQGMKPDVNPSSWFTKERIRPLLGSATTTLPLVAPSASTAARRMTRSSPSTLSPSVGSTGGGRRTAGAGLATVLLAAAGPPVDEAPLFALPAANWAFHNRPATTSGSRKYLIHSSPEDPAGAASRSSVRFWTDLL